MLDIEAVRSGYGAINVLWDTTLSVPAGRVTTIIGPNGAGKTTLLRTVSGLIAPTAGRITLDGVEIAGRPSWRMSDLGLSMIPEGRMIFKGLTIEENLMLGAFPRRLRARAPANRERAYAMFPALAERRHRLAGTLSGGQAQMLAMARGLMSEPRLLLVDEPSLGLAPIVVEDLFVSLRRLKDDGLTIVLVEQNTRLACELADHVHLMKNGRVMLSLDGPEIDLARIHDAYF